MSFSWMPVAAHGQHASPARRRFSSSERLAARISPASESVNLSCIARTILRRQIRANHCRIRMTSRSTQFTLPAAADVGQRPPPPSTDTSGIPPSCFGSPSPTVASDSFVVERSAIDPGLADRSTAFFSTRYFRARLYSSIVYGSMKIPVPPQF
ncbi:hypothetical protein EIB72_30215 [Burkholderia ambifaria]|uniref:hypothetical protein n=1 Tax=Burkholderia ambifaria TaxID=152480 RepID=UPI0013FD8A90|nr:hypothetical protein [Burkholderia ambifaria]NHL70652.1 hypothetical protein [Burkholderia ambifaria]